MSTFHIYNDGDAPNVRCTMKADDKAQQGEHRQATAARSENTVRKSQERPMRGVYIISVAARILDMHPQTLRKYERMGLVTPSRTEGMLRLYSEDDIARLRLIKRLVDDLGLNLAGVHLALNVFNQLLDMRRQLSDMESRDLKSFLEESLEEMFALLNARL
jgi:MerR family transcriptional regulator/heat shock protein HspR